MHVMEGSNYQSPFLSTKCSKRNGLFPTKHSLKNWVPIPYSELVHPSPSHKVQCSEGLPTPMGEAGRVRPCRQRRSGSPHAPWKAGGRSETERALLHHTLIKIQDGNSPLQISTPLLIRTECSGTKRHLTTKEMKRISNSDKPPPPPHSKKGVYLHAKRVHYNHTTYTKGGNYKWIKQNLTN